MAFSQFLPAPGTLINVAGVLDNINGQPAPGFAGIGLKSHVNVQVLESRSNRGMPVSEGGHAWSFSIKYHTMTRSMFDSLESFILGMHTRVNPFYVILPNYSQSKNAAFNTFNSTNDVTIQGGAYAGDTSVVLTAPVNIPNNATPLPGDLFNIVDSGDALHKNVYKVTRVETAAVHAGSQPATGKPRIHFFPPLQRDKAGTATLVFQNPAFRVIQKGDFETEYDNNNLISFSLNVREIMP